MHYFYRIFMRRMKDSENNCKYGLDELCPFWGVFMWRRIPKVRCSHIHHGRSLISCVDVVSKWVFLSIWFYRKFVLIFGWGLNSSLVILAGTQLLRDKRHLQCNGNTVSIRSLWSVTTLKYVVYRLYVQEPTANILLQNLPSTVGQQQHTVATAQNQLSALLASGSCGSAPTATGGASNHVVLSQLLQV